MKPEIKSMEVWDGTIIDIYPYKGIVEEDCIFISIHDKEDTEREESFGMLLTPEQVTTLKENLDNVVKQVMGANGNKEE